MPCRPFTHAGLTGIICTRARKPRQCCECHRPGTYLCDAVVVRRGKQTTCDRPICADHRTTIQVDAETGDSIDLCPRCAVDGGV